MLNHADRGLKFSRNDPTENVALPVAEFIILVSDSKLTVTS